MNKKTFFLIAISLLMPMFLFSQTYSSLWKQAKDAEEKDLPQTEQEILTKIVEKAEKEKAYGQLLKAELQRAKSQCDVAPDSLKPVVERLQQRAEQAQANVPLQAIYHCVLGYIYQHNRWLDEDQHQQIGTGYYTKALAQPQALAAVKATDYDPFVEKGQDSRYFDDDLLSLIGQEAGRYDLLREHYLKTGNRRAALLASLRMLADEEPLDDEPLNKSRHIQRIDSLISQYEDLTECGEAALMRFDYMEQHTDATPEQLWQYINLALERWGAWPRMNKLRNSMRELTRPTYSAQAEHDVVTSNQKQTLQLSSLRAISELTLRLYSVKGDGTIEYNPRYSEDYKKLKPLLTALPQYTQTRKYVGKRPYELFEDSLTLPALPVGVYMVETETQPSTDTDRQLLFVSDVRVVSLSLPDDKMRLAVVNAITGQPLKNAKVKLEYGYGRQKSTETLTTNQQGECIASGHRTRMTVWGYTDSDRACPSVSSLNQFSYDNRVHSQHNIDIFTDRAIYRPGQTVHAAVIAYSTDNGRDHHADAKRDITVQLRDANGKLVEEKKVTTDDFGTCAAQFTLPTQGLTGAFTIRANGHSHIFSVEEYKRPAFEVDIPRVSQSYEEGDTVVAHGTAQSYAGVPVQGATVKYKVVRRMAFWWMSYSRYWNSGIFGTGSNEEVMAEGETVTDEKGQFTVDMPMIIPHTRHTMFYNFVLTADVTDQAGETHQGAMSLPLGNKKTAFMATLPEQVLNEAGSKMAFHQQNAAGIDLDATVRYRFDNQGRWLEARTNEVLPIPQMKSGRHTLNAICESDTLQQDFVMFSLDDRRPATDTRSWFFTSHDGQFPMSGDAVTVQAGSSDKDVHVLYAVISGEKVLESGATDLSNELINRKMKYTEDYGDGVSLYFAWMKEGKTYTYSSTIRRPMPDMHLSMKWNTFRNKLTPGQQEEWTLTVAKPDGSPADAQLMATLYDKSLDQLTPHEWSLAPSAYLRLPSTWWVVPNWSALALKGQKNLQRLHEPSLLFNHFDKSVYPSYSYYSRRGRLYLMKTRAKEAMMSGGEMALEEGAPMLMGVQTAAVANDAMDMAEAEAANEDAGGGKEAKAEEQAPMQMRENLQETAFFLPQLVCDSTGRVSMKFTLPESLTTWRFIGIAHTRDMMFGSMTGEAVARKELMIQPNMPRFLREGDKGTITARIMNMSDKEISGTARLQLLDPETEQVLAERTTPVTVKDSSTVSVTFDIDAAMFAGRTLAIVRTSMSSKNYSDGEQHYLALLPSTERVTVTRPFTQNNPGTLSIDLTQLIPVSDPQSKITVEYTNNPAWLMIQALPTVGHPHDDCAICQAASLYANSIGRHILQQNPQARNVFELWSREQGNETALMSSLQKDQELKDLVLSETPWVMDADREQEQKSRLADFFEPNTIVNRIEKAVENLQKLQNGDGSWSWWPGMKGSAYMTMAVSEMMVRLNEMTSEQKETKKMLENSFKFLGNDIVELVNEMKKQEKKGVKQTFPSHYALQWLYICTLDGRTLPHNVAEANSYLKNLLKKDVKNQTIYEKALSAIVLDNKTYVKSLKEWTVYKEETGRYYDTQRASYSWRDYKIPTQVAAIEALKRLTPQDSVTICEMQRWLLQSKRTQAWDTPLNSADAIYAFLNGNTQALQAQPKTVLALDGKAIDTSSASAGLGYVKQAQHYNGEKTFTAEKTSTGTSWGAVYAQFTQATHDIADQQSGISVKREVRMDDSQKQASAAQLKVGDRITVRITIEAERDYDFVQLQDKRAACMEPVQQLSGYSWRGGYYCTPRDYATNYYFDRLSKGRHIIETQYYIDREGDYETGTCTVQCAYSPEYRATTGSATLKVSSK